MDRRSLLKLFGVGATVAPLAADGSLIVQATAKLVEPAKVTLYERLPWQSPMGLMVRQKPVYLQVRLINEDGVMEMEAQSVVTKVSVQPPYFSSGGMENLDWQITGKVIAPMRIRPLWKRM